MPLPATRRRLHGEEMDPMSSNTTDDSVSYANSNSNSSEVEAEYDMGADNTTGIYVIEDEGLVETEMGGVGYTDIQTVLIACMATMLLLVFTLVTVICIRFMWKKLREQRDEGYRGVLARDESTDPLAGKSQSTSGHHLPDELKVSESQFTMRPGDDIEEIGSNQSPVLNYANLSSSIQNHTSKTGAAANGSIITMTLKNNHLIVETEERGVPIPENAKTTTKFTATSSPHHNNVFVVEVQHANDEPSYLPPCTVYPHVSVSSQEDIYAIDEDVDEDGRVSTSQRAQVHQPPLEATEDSEEDDVASLKLRPTTNTGLSQSDLSISSAGSNNPSYRYGNQFGYDGGHFGYPQYVGYVADGGDSRKANGETAVTSASINSMTEPLLEGQDEELHLNEQMKLGNGVEKCDGVVNEAAMRTNGEGGELDKVPTLGTLPILNPGVFPNKTDKSAIEEKQLKFNKIVHATLEEIVKDEGQGMVRSEPQKS